MERTARMHNTWKDKNPFGQKGSRKYYFARAHLKKRVVQNPSLHWSLRVISSDSSELRSSEWKHVTYDETRTSYDFLFPDLSGFCKLRVLLGDPLQSDSFLLCRLALLVKPIPPAPATAPQLRLFLRRLGFPLCLAIQSIEVVQQI